MDPSVPLSPTNEASSKPKSFPLLSRHNKNPVPVVVVHIISSGVARIGKLIGHK